MKDKIILFVKSEKIPMIQYSEGVPGHPCTGAYRATSIVPCYKRRDQEAIDLLEKTGVVYECVDLSMCDAPTQRKARMAGLNETPMLIFQGRAIKGLENIKQVLQKDKAEA